MSWKETIRRASRTNIKTWRQKYFGTWAQPLTQPGPITVNAGRTVGLDWARPSSSSTDRIDHIAAVASVTGTDRSRSRWKIKTNAQNRKRKRSRENFNLHYQTL